MGQLDITAFPDCAPRSNDERMVREFLLFLYHYGFCYLIKGKTNLTDKFFLQPFYTDSILHLLNTPTQPTSYNNIVSEIRLEPIITEIERQKVLTKITARPQQAKFRKQVLERFNNTCIFTGEQISIVLEACHIIPVEHRGNDTPTNGLCLRADIHTLFDSRHIRINPNGLIEYSDVMQKSVSYSSLPKVITIPNFVSSEAISWRYDYY